MSIDKQTRTDVLNRDNNECQNCQSTDRLEAHHIKRKQAGGTDEMNNLITLCRRCHMAAHALADGDVISPDVLSDVPTPSDIRGLGQPQDQIVLDTFTKGKGEGGPWGRVTCSLVVEKTGLSKSNVQRSLRSLRKAGWIMRPSRGCYEFVTDPREGKDE